MSRLTTLHITVLLLGLAASLRLFHIGTQSLWIDEVYSLHQVQRDWSSLLLPAGYDEIHPPFYYLTVKPVYELALSSRRWMEAILRLPAAIYSSLGAIALYWLGSMLFDRRSGALAGFFYAISAFSIWYGQEVRMYSLAMLLVIVQIALTIRATREGAKHLDWALLYLSGSAALLTHWYAVFSWPALLLYVFADPQRRQHMRRLAIVVGSIGATAALYLMPKMLGGRAEMVGAVDWKNIAYSIWSMWVGYSAGPSSIDLHSDPIGALSEFLPSLLGFSALAAVVGGSVVWTLLRKWRDTPILFVVLWIGIGFFGPLVLALLAGKAHNARYSFTVFPAVLLLVGVAVTSTRTSSLRVALVAAYCVAQLWSLTNYYWNPYYWREDFRGVARALETDSQAKGKLLLSVATDQCLAAYGLRSWQWREYPHWRPWSEELRAAIDERRRQGREIWLVTGSRWWDEEAKIHAHLSTGFSLVKHQSWNALDLWVFRPR